MSMSWRRRSARPIPDLGVVFVRWSFVRSLSWRGYWLLMSLSLVVVAELPSSQLIGISVAQASTVLVAELPAGLVADAWSRRRALVIAHVSTGAGMVVAGLVSSFPALAGSQMLCGLGWAFTSGADVAWVSDELDDPATVARVLAVRARWELLGAAAGMLAFGGVAWVAGLRTGVVVAGLVMTTLAVVVLRFPERRFAPADPGERWRVALLLLGDAATLARRDRPIRLIAAAWCLINGSADVYGRLHDQRLLELGFAGGDRPVIWFTALGLATLAIGAISIGMIEHRVHDERVARRTIVAGCLLGTVGLIAFAHAPDERFAIAGVMLATGSGHPGTVVRATTEIWVNRRSTATVRATMLSLLSLAEHLGEITVAAAMIVLAGAGPTPPLLGSALVLVVAAALVASIRS